MNFRCKTSCKKKNQLWEFQICSGSLLVHIYQSIIA